MPRIALPLAPATPYDSWDNIIARTQPLQGDVLRDDNDLAMIIYTSGSTGQPKGAMHNFARMGNIAHSPHSNTKLALEAGKLKP